MAKHARRDHGQETIGDGQDYREFDRLSCARTQHWLTAARRGAYDAARAHLREQRALFADERLAETWKNGTIWLETYLLVLQAEEEDLLHDGKPRGLASYAGILIFAFEVTRVKGYPAPSFKCRAGVDGWGVEGFTARDGLAV